MSDNLEVAQAVEASREYRQTQGAFDEVRDGLIEQLQSVTTQEGAYRVAMSLQVLEQVRSTLLAAAQGVTMADYEKRLSEEVQG